MTDDRVKKDDARLKDSDMENGELGDVDGAMNKVENDKRGNGKKLINIYMLPVKLTYFLWGCTNGSYPIYLNPFLVSSGISRTKAGFITGTIFAVSSVAAPLWGMLSDYTGRRKLILALICITAAASMFTLPIAESQLVTSSIVKNSTCPAMYRMNRTTTWMNNTNNETYHETYYFTNITRPCANITVPIRERCTFRMCRGDLNTLFYAMLFIVSIGAIFFAPLPSYVDAIAFNVIKTSPVKASYGGQRIFGTLGGIATMYLTAFLIDRYQFDGMSTYAIAFFVFVPISLLLIPCGCFISLQYERNLACNPKQYEDPLMPKKKVGDEDDEKGSGNQMRKILLEMLGRCDVVVFMITALVSGMAINLFVFFTEMLVDDVLSVSKRDASFIFIVHNLTSIITFPFSAKLVRLMGGPKPTMILGMLCHAVRNIIMSYTQSYLVMLSIQSLHCLDFALLLCAMMEYIHDISPGEIKMTMTLIFRTVKYSVGTFLVNLLGGFVYQNYGGRILFRWTGILCGMWGVFLCVYYGLTYYKSKHIKGKNASCDEKDQEYCPDSPTLCNTFTFHSCSNEDLRESDV